MTKAWEHMTPEERAAVLTAQSERVVATYCGCRHPECTDCYPRKIKRCIWRRDTRLQSIIAYQMTCNSSGNLTAVSGALGYKFCPFCGNPLVFETC